MRISFDPNKRAKALLERGLDFANAGEIFAGTTVTLLDDRFEYGEERFQTYGKLGGAVVMVVWTPRADSRHIISMRKCNEREKKKFADQLGKN